MRRLLRVIDVKRGDELQVAYLVQVLLYALAVACCWVFGAFMGWLSRRELQRQGTKQ